MDTQLRVARADAHQTPEFDHNHPDALGRTAGPAYGAVDDPRPARLVSYLSLPFSVAPAEGARTSVFLASSAEVSGVFGQYFTRSRRAPVKNTFDTEANRALLWDLSSNAVDGHVATAVPRAG